MSLDLPPLHRDLAWVTPLSEERAARLVAFLGEDAPGTVLDVGCGWAELLLRVLESCPAARGVGLDVDAAAIEHGRGLAEARGLAGRVRLDVADGATAAGPVDAVICIGASQTWGPPVEDRQPLDYASALAALRALLPVGGRLVYGEAVWSAAPTPAATAPLAGRDDEFLALPDLLELAVAHDFAVMHVGEASLGEWDAFESGFTARHARWLAAHGPDHPDAAEVWRQAARQRSAYYSGYRGVLGLAYLCLVAV